MITHTKKKKHKKKNKTTQNKKKGNQMITKCAQINEIPLFVKEGSILPTLPKNKASEFGIASQVFTDLNIYFYPFFKQNIKNVTSISIYDDDGISPNYLFGNQFYTNTTFQWNSNISANQT